MPDKDKDPNLDDDKDKKNQDPKGDDDKGKKDDDKPSVVPKHEFDQTYKRMKDAERKAEELEQANQKREEDEARAKGEHEKLANDYKGKLDTASAENENLKKQREEDDKVFESILAGHMSQISDENKALIPDDFSVRQKIAYIEKNRERLMKAGAKGEPGQPKGDGKNPSDEEATLQAEFDTLKEKAKKNGVLMGADRSRFMELNRKLAEMKAAKK